MRNKEARSQKLETGMWKFKFRIPHSFIPHSAFRIPHSYVPRSAFTLLELLVGLTIATFIVGSAAVVFVTTMDNWDRGSKVARLTQAAQTTADLIERYLRCATPPGQSYGTFTGEDLSTEASYGHRLTFLSSAEGRFPRAMARTDVSEIEFTLDPSQDGVLTMRIDSTPDDDPFGGGIRVQLSNLIQGFWVLYYNGTEWVETWDQSQLPKAVEFHLLVGDPQDLTPEGEIRVKEISRLVWLPMGKELPPQTTGAPDETSGGRQPGNGQ